ncbi:hypothetical protein [Streptomyces sp. YKOK-I1]
MMRPSMSRRIAAAVLGAGRRTESVERASAIARQRHLPLGRRLLTSILGVRAAPAAYPQGDEDAAAPSSPRPDLAGSPEATLPPPRTAFPPARGEKPGPRARGDSTHEDGSAHGSRSTVTVARHLLGEDRQEYERILDEALRSAAHRSESAPVGQRLDPEQLRTMALHASALITAAAATEYQHYVRVRKEPRRPAPVATTAPSGSASGEPGAGGVGLATATQDAAEATGAGAMAVAAVLTPVLAGTASVIFLLTGYLLRAAEPGHAAARALVSAGWLFAGVAAAAVLVSAVGLLLTALRNRPGPEAGPSVEPGDEVDRARDAWREALLERGILPFLREAQADPDIAVTPNPKSPPPTPHSRLPDHQPE